MPRVMLGALLVIVASPMTARAQCSAAPQIVDEVYRQVLERQADPAAAMFVEALSTGKMTVRSVVAAVAKSEEHRVRFFLRPVVVGVYRDVMRRDPSPTEIQTATSDLANGASLDAFVAHTAVRAVNNRPDAVRMLYVLLLDREPDADGLRNYTEAARQQGVEAVARSLVQSGEYRARTQDNTAMFVAGVRTLYQQLLGREPDPAGLAQGAQLAAVYGLDAVVDRLLDSREYLERYGENAVPGRRELRLCGPGSAQRTAIPR